MSSSSDFQDAKQRVLAILKREAPRKVSTWGLINETRHSRAVARVWELINVDGYQIEHTKKGRVHYWRYLGEKIEKQSTLFDVA